MSRAAITLSETVATPARLLRRAPHLETTTLGDTATLAFGTTAPHAVVDVFCQCVLKAVGNHRAVRADCSCSLDTCAVARKEHGGRKVAAVAASHPFGGFRYGIHGGGLTLSQGIGGSLTECLMQS